MMRHADMVMIVMKEGVYTHQSLETGIACHARPHGEAPAEASNRETRRKHGQEPPLWFPCGENGQGRASRMGIGW